MINSLSIKTKFGWFSVFENNGKIIRVKFGKTKKQSKNKILEAYKRSLIDFFNKKTPKIKAPYKIEGNFVQKKIWSELKKINLGQTKSYGEIAKIHRLSPRHVGKICGQNKLLLSIPCHRVIKSDGTLGGFSSIGGVKLKKKLLNFEKTWNMES